MRVSIAQPALPQYRIPLFQRLSDLVGSPVAVWTDLSRSVSFGTTESSFARIIVKSAPLVRLGPVVWQRHIIRLIKRTRCEAVILSFNLRHAELVPALTIARHMQVPVLLWGHGFGARAGTRLDIPRAAIARLADAVVVYGDLGRKHLESIGVPSGSIFVARNGLDTGTIRRAMSAPDLAQRTEALRDKHRLAQKHVLLHISRLTGKRDLSLLLEAFAASALPSNSILVIIGEGEERTELGNIAERLAIGNAILFAGEIYGAENLAPWLNLADVAVFPSNGGLGIIHAMAAGLPIICGDDPRLHGPEFEAQIDGHTGWSYTHGSVRALRDAITQAIGDAGDRRRRALNAISRACDVFDVDHTARGLKDAAEYATSRYRKSPRLL